MYENMDIPLILMLSFGTCIGFVMGHARGYKIGRREGVVRGRILARREVNQHESI
jgi:hypothetical protein